MLCHAGVDVSALLFQTMGSMTLLFSCFARCFEYTPQFKQKKKISTGMGLWHNLAFEEQAELLEIISAQSSSLKSTVCPPEQHGFNRIAMFFPI